ncbi:hypothetical protein [Amycolatopsis sp. NPDC051071]|uniref:hypothetical protein n=1 Tax=Amycolatopsis sp. NPDC051071 TaxID=3154637 RepID=UPI003425ACB1
MSNVVMIAWFFAVAAAGLVGGVVLGLLVARERPSQRALDAHDELVIGEFTKKLRALVERDRQQTTELAEISKDIGEAVDRIEGVGRG